LAGFGSFNAIQTKRNPGSYQPKLDEEEVPEVYGFKKTLQRVSSERAVRNFQTNRAVDSVRMQHRPKAGTAGID
jgi:hypothetical protein